MGGTVTSSIIAAARVRAELLAERQTKTDGALYGKLRERYEIVVERPQARPLTAE
ncbi:MAG: hypothetical protein GWN98_11840 [Gammaproteobacteria bacterium]|nr:hypothetical protein [Gammaproteobacteria bacterium]NIU40954.1 hypothetical protein [Gammaproteobacteria bacterium]